MKNWTKKFLLVLCMVMLCAFTMASAEEVATFELPTETTTIQTGVAAETVTVTLENAEGVWSLAGVTAGEAAGEPVEAEIPAGLVTVAAMVNGTETVVDLAQVAVVSATETGLKLTVNANDVAAAMGDKYVVGDLKATTLSFEVAEVTTVKVAFELVAPVTVYYVDGVDGEVLFPSLKFTCKVGEKTPEYNGVEPTREGFEFDGWNEWNPVVKGETIYEAQWREYFTVTYFDWYDQKVLAEFTVLDGDPTPTIDPNRYTKASYVNMGFTTAIAPTVTGDVTYTMMQMVPPRENNVSGISFVCTCPNNEDHCKTFAYSATLANYLRIDDISEDVYFDGTNYKCVVYLQDDMTDFNTYYNGRFTKVKNSHNYVSRDISSFTVTLDMNTKRWVADTAAINVQYVCPTAPIANANTISKTKINVQCPDLNLKMFNIYLEAGTVSFGQVTGSYAEGEWYVTVTVNSFDPYIEAFETKYGEDVALDAVATGAVTYTYKYTLASHGLVHSDGSNWALQETTYVQNNGKTVYVTPVTE